MNGFPVGRLFGFEVRVHLSWVFILAVVAVLAVGQIEQLAPALDPALRWLVAAVIAAAFFVSVLVHELAHGLAARRRGLRTGPILVLFFGGSAALDTEARTPADEAVVAGAGPVVSLLIGALLAVAGAGLQVATDPFLVGLGAVLFVLGVLNLILGSINLVPAFPLDGGRLVRALVWGRTGSPQRGMAASAKAGRLMGWALVGAGLVIMIGGSTIDGLLVGLCGWFLNSASRAVTRRLVVEDLLRGVTVGEVMERDVPAVAPGLTVDTFADQMLEGDGPMAMPVIRDGRVLGVIGRGQVRRAGRKTWATKRAEELMVAPPVLPFLDPGETLWSALDRLRDTGLDGLPVVVEGSLLGVLSRRSIAETIQHQAQRRGVPLP